MMDKANVSKPSISDPWRYVCPNCERQVYISSGKFRCQKCNERYEKHELTDLKQ